MTKPSAQRTDMAKPYKETVQAFGFIIVSRGKKQSMLRPENDQTIYTATRHDETIQGISSSIWAHCSLASEGRGNTKTTEYKIPVNVEGHNVRKGHTKTM